MLIQRDPEDQIFIVTVPELPGCRTHGATYEEAVQQGKDAIETWLMGTDPSRIPAPEYFDLEGQDPPAWQRAWGRSELRRAS
jgi:predicted RNase H-like HicB family nuclease